MADSDNHGKHKDRVTFAEGTHLDAERVHAVSDGTAYHLPEAHVGILRNHHTYHVDVLVTHDLGPEIELDQPNYNLYVRYLEVGETERVSESGRGQFNSVVKVEVKTVKEGRIREKIFLNSATDSDKKLEVLVTAQVLEHTRGTPLLKTGVRLVSHEVEDESDWPGHSSH